MIRRKSRRTVRENDRSIETLKHRFNELAEQHDGSFRANGVGFIEQDENARLYDAIVEDILLYSPPLHEMLAVLEIGCGTGEILVRLKPKVKAVRGVDVSDRMVGVCRGRGLDADVVGRKLPFSEQSFDMVILYSVLINIDDGDLLDDMISEAFRMVRPGGVVFLGNVPNIDHLQFLVHRRPTIKERLRKTVKNWLGQKSDGNQIRYFAYHPEQFIRYCDRFGVDRFIVKRSLLSGSGLEKIDVIYRLGEPM